MYHSIQDLEPKVNIQTSYSNNKKKIDSLHQKESILEYAAAKHASDIFSNGPEMLFAKISNWTNKLNYSIVFGLK